MLTPRSVVDCPSRLQHKRVWWLCNCECGGTVTASENDLQSGHKISCGCARGLNKITHGLCGTSEYSMYRGAKHRAAKKNIPFDIELSDVVIPALCPVLGIPLVRKSGKGPKPNSPSIDQIRPGKGYVHGNICVMSHRANTIKSNATAEELEAVAQYIRATAAS